MIKEIIDKGIHTLQFKVKDTELNELKKLLKQKYSNKNVTIEVKL